MMNGKVGSVREELVSQARILQAELSLGTGAKEVAEKKVGLRSARGHHYR